MGWWLIIGICIALAAGGWLVLIGLGAAMPSDPLALSSLRKHLRAVGISATSFSKPCMKELVSAIVSMSKLEMMMDKNGPTNAYIDDTAQAFARDIHALICGEGHFAAAEIAHYAESNFLWRILALHHPEKFSLENLQTTQDVNSILRGR
jgi:hypothetical protein